MSVVTKPPRDDAAAELREEIERLVQIASRRPEIVVREGRPGSGWSFDWEESTVSVDPDDLRLLAPDLCRGLAIHEASHAAITVLHRFLPEGTLVRLLPLLNAVEDLRIDAWMRTRFPGAAPWLDAHNTVVHATIRKYQLPRSRQVQFLLGILERGYFGTTATGTLPEVIDSLETCRAPITRAVACQPPAGDEDAGIMASQRAMWGVVRDRILPTWTKLAAMDRDEGIGDLARREIAAFMARTGGSKPGRPGRRQGCIQRGPVRRCLGPAARPAAAEVVAAPGAGHGGACSKQPPSTRRFLDRYDAAWKQVAPLADRLGDELLRVLVPSRRMRWSDGQPSGPRLATRRAMQFEADPRCYRELWSRPILPVRRDPAVLLLVDRSGSMKKSGLIDRAMEGTVLLAEVCHRIGVPAAVWSFANAILQEVSWNDRLNDNSRRRIGTLPDRCDGRTDMAAALAVAGRTLASRTGDPRILFVISDGAPDNHVATLAAVASLEKEKLITVGIGLGPGTSPLARYFRRSVVEISPETLVERLAGLLGESLREHLIDSLGTTH